ncbi:dehydrogenase [Natronorubrum sp. JWXQ-INN-674]|uniref:Dehydrogenase n=1 Tax=Natronorubrum halalkaliphilum TaxID=2691917 RepID=A0A6B0VT14_9EURY|nr:molecular chaperone TorD family protein [Natronorubrum halalkaliphilum]MXV64217.1 dehydrogenase [Natronorubrum halalkaliphilum]
MTTETHVHRARLYKLASLAFDRPDDELEAALVSGDFTTQLLESADALADDELRDRAQKVAETAPTDPAAVDERYSDWATLFGFEKGGEIQQYQIEYSPGTLVTSTDTLADISGFYKAFGLSLAAENRERADHLCLQLEFLSHLALQTAYLDLDGDESGVDIVTNAQGDFLEDHLGRWIPRFNETVQDESHVAFYRALAALVERLVEIDADRFDADPDVFAETPPSPTEQFINDDSDGGDFRCGTCGTTPSPTGDQEPAQQLPMGDRDGPY